MGNTVSRKGSAVSPPRRRASAADSPSSPALPTPPVTFFLNITPDPALPVELIEHVVTAAWTLPMPWSERVELRTRLHLVNRTWHSVTSRVVLAHLFVVATERAVRRIDAQLSQRPRALLRSLVTYRDFCTSLTLRLPRGRELVRFLRDDAQPFMASLTHLTHLGLDFTSTPPSPIHNTVEQQAGYTTLSIIFQLMEYAGPISSIVLKLGCPTHPHPEFTFGDLRQQQFPSITRAWLDTDNGPLAVHFLQQCYNVRELRLTCAFYGVVTELSHLLTWLTRLTLVVACHPRVRPPCAHADADSHPLKSWTIPLALKRGLLQPELGRPHGTLILEGADAIALGCEDETSFRRVMQAAAQARVIEFRARKLREYSEEPMRLRKKYQKSTISATFRPLCFRTVIISPMYRIIHETVSKSVQRGILTKRTTAQHEQSREIGKERSLRNVPGRLIYPLRGLAR